MKIGIGNEHSALEMKKEIIAYLEGKGHEVIDYGTNSAESCDYPVYGEIVARAVAAGAGVGGGSKWGAAGGGGGERTGRQGRRGTAPRR